MSATNETRRRMAEPMKFPLNYGGIQVDNLLTYMMLNELPIKALKWLRDTHGNKIAEYLVTEIDKQEATKVSAVSDYRSTLREKLDDEEFSIPLSAKIEKALERIRKQQHLSIDCDFDDEPKPVMKSDDFQEDQKEDYSWE